MMMPIVMAALCSKYSGVLVEFEDVVGAVAVVVRPLSSLGLFRRSLRACTGWLEFYEIVIPKAE